MKKTLFPISLFFALILFWCGTSPVEKAKDFYFPYKKLSTETFYLYVNQNDTTDLMCWSMQSEVVDKDTLFSTIIYDKNSVLLESLTEKITPTGSEMLSYHILSNNNIKIPDYSDCSIKEKAIYNWVVSPNENFKWSVSYVTAGTKVSLSKTRQYSGTVATIKSYGKDYKCMLFNDAFETRYSAMNGPEGKPILYSAESYYGLNTGLIRFKVTMPDKTVKDYLLKKITTVKPY